MVLNLNTRAWVLIPAYWYQNPAGSVADYILDVQPLFVDWETDEKRMNGLLLCL